MNITKSDNSILVELDKDEMTYLSDSLLDPLIWIETLVREKIDNCKARLFNNWIPKLRAQPGLRSIPTEDAELLRIILEHPDYKNRVEQG